MHSIMSAFRPLRFRGKYRLMSLIAPKRGVRSARIFGYRMDLDLADWIQRNMYFGPYEQPQTSCILSHLRPGMTFVDVGANVGYYSAMASSTVGDAGRVVSYEPNPYSFDRLSGWVQANQARNITPVCVALGGEEGTLITPPRAKTTPHRSSLSCFRRKPAKQLSLPSELWTPKPSAWRFAISMS